MSRKVHLVLFIATVVSYASAQSEQNPVRFSRLLNTQSDLLRFTSISNLGPVSPVLEQKFSTVLSQQQQQQQQPQVPQFQPQQQFRHRLAEVIDDDSRLITKPEPGQEYVLIHQQLKPRQEEESRESITSINQKSISGRKPFALLRQSANGNRLNISPVFPSSTNSRNNNIKGNDAVTILSRDFIISQDESDVTTVNPLNEDQDGVTTEGVQNDEDFPATTTFSSVVPEKKQKKDRMVINVITSAPRVVFDNTTNAPTTFQTTFPTATTTEAPPSTTTTTTSTSTTTNIPQNNNEDDENLVVDAFHRNGHFPDFEDSPAHLHTAESNQPARVNVRPANAGKDYEYEYIYYYYDDEDDDNSTAKKSETLPKSTLVDHSIPQEIPDFTSEKIGVSKTQPINSIEVPSSRNQKSFSRGGEVAREEIVPVPVPQPQQPFVSQSQPQPQSHAHAFDDESPEEVGQVTTILPEILRTARPNSVNRPVVLKQSKLHPVSAIEPQLTTTERSTTTTTTTTTTTAAPPSETPRFRGRNKIRTEAPAVNQFTQDANEEQTPPRRPFKDGARRRNPTRRFQAQQPIEPQQVQTEVENEQAAVEESPRLPGRTRFPPRQTTQVAAGPELAITEASVAPVAAVQDVAQSVESPTSDADYSTERKAKDNFARQKSITDLYALTRLHQLAINTRVPNRVQPKVVAGFVNSAEQTTKYADDATGGSSSEATTLASSFPSAVSAEQPSTDQVQTTSTTTTTTSTTTTEAAPAENNRFAVGRGQKNRFRQRGNRLNAGTPADGTSTTTTETASRAPANPNRFGGRRRPFSPTTAATPSDAENTNTNSNVEQQSVRPVQQTRAPVRNRFAGRTRPTTTTTEATDAAARVEGEQAETGAERVQPQRRRPNFQGRRRNQQLQQASAPNAENVETSSPANSQAAPAPAPRDGERRRFNFGNPARNRPSGPGAGRPLVRGRLVSTTEAAPVAQEHQEPIVSEQVTITESEQPENTQQQEQQQAPIVSISSTTSSSVSTDVVESNRGSSGVLGRLRNRTKPVATTTTAPAPEVHLTPERKPSRLSGILNRRKLNGGAPAAVTEDTQEEQAPEIVEQPQQQRQGVVVQVSSTVTESEEVSEAHEIEQEPSSTTHASILNRVKSNRKPGSIVKSNRKAQPQSSSE